MGNDVDLEAHAAAGLTRDLVHGERDAVERYRSLGRDKGCERGICRDGQAGRIALRGNRLDPADAVDVAGDDGAAQLVADPERPLEIEPALFGPHARSGTSPSLRGDVDGEPASALVDDGQADARTGDRGAEVDPGHVIAAADPHPEVASRLDLLDHAEVGDDSGEHAPEWSLVECRAPFNLSRD